MAYVKNYDPWIDGAECCTPAPGAQAWDAAAANHVEQGIFDAAAVADQALVDAGRTALGATMQAVPPRVATPEIPTVTWATASGYSGVKTLMWNHADFLGKIDQGANLKAYAGWGSNQPAYPGTSQNPIRLQFWLYGQDVAVRTQSIFGGACEYEVWVDGHRVINAVKPHVADENHMKLAFATVGTRLITVILSSGSIVECLKTPSTGYVTANLGDRFKVGLIGDSYVQGAYFGPSGELPGASTFPQIMSNLTGWEIYSAGYGGTGYVDDEPGQPGSHYGGSTRLTQFAELPPLDLIIVQGSVNDPLNSETTLDVTTNQTLLYDALAAARPSTPIVVAGPQPVPSFSYASVQALSDAMKPVALAHPQVRGFVDWFNPQWITGTGNFGSKTGDGNADLFMQEGLHPSPAGAAYIARRMVLALSGIKV